VGEGAPSAATVAPAIPASIAESVRAARQGGQDYP